MQIRVLKWFYPSLCFQEALAKSGLPSLELRRDTACRNLFIAMQEPKHKLHQLLPPKRPSHYSAHNGKVMSCLQPKQIGLRTRTALFHTACTTFNVETCLSLWFLVMIHLLAPDLMLFLSIYCSVSMYLFNWMMNCFCPLLYMFVLVFTTAYMFS